MNNYKIPQNILKKLIACQCELKWYKKNFSEKEKIIDDYERQEFKRKITEQYWEKVHEMDYEWEDVAKDIIIKKYNKRKLVENNEQNLQ